jgi:hypothetical protein
MARKTTSKRVVKSVSRTGGSPSRDLLLAGIGAFSLGRKQAIASYENFGQNAADLGERVSGSIKNFETEARKLRKKTEGKVEKLRQQAEEQIVPIRKKVLAVVTEAKAQAEARLAPVFGRLGIKKATKKRAASKRVPIKKAAVKRTRRAA